MLRLFALHGRARLFHPSLKRAPVAQGSRSKVPGYEEAAEVPFAEPLEWPSAMKNPSRPNTRQPWTAAELDRIRALAAEHKPVREIARLLGRTAPAVQNKAIKEGIATTRAKQHKYTLS